MSGKNEILVVAGEASADLHAARILRDLKAKDSTLSFVGVGGKHLREAGMKILVDSAEINLIGLTEVVSKLASVYKKFQKVQKYPDTHPIRAALLIDLPDFNLRLARQLKKKGIPVIYYVSPQVWAWRKSRLHDIQRDVDSMLVLFEFEKSFYQKHGVPVNFVGHPFVDEIQPRNAFRSRDQRLTAPRIALLPGSRKSEIRKHVPILRELYSLLKERYPRAQFRIPVAHTLNHSLVADAFAEMDVFLSEEGTDAVVKWSDVAVVASGTAVLEVTLTETPMCLYYLLNQSTAFLLRKIWKFKMNIGISNLLMGKEIIREFQQEDAQASLIFPEVRRLLEDEVYREQHIQDLRACRQKLGGKNALARTSAAVESFLNNLSSSRQTGVAGLARPLPQN